MRPAYRGASLTIICRRMLPGVGNPLPAQATSSKPPDMHPTSKKSEKRSHFRLKRDICLRWGPKHPLQHTPDCTCSGGVSQLAGYWHVHTDRSCNPACWQPRAFQLHAPADSSQQAAGWWPHGNGLLLSNTLPCCLPNCCNIQLPLELCDADGVGVTHRQQPAVRHIRNILAKDIGPDILTPHVIVLQLQQLLQLEMQA